LKFPRLLHQVIELGENRGKFFRREFRHEPL